MEFHVNGLTDDYVRVGRLLLDTDTVVVRDQITRELTNVTFIVDDVATAPLLPIGVGRRVNLKLAAVEALQLISGMYSHDLLIAAAPQYEHVLVDRTDPNYAAYPARTAQAITNVVEMLRESPSSRQAVVTIWKPEDLTHVGDRPCTLTLQFLIRPIQPGVEPKLELHVNMRSQDFWLGVPYDFFMFSQLQLSVARALQIAPGRYIHRATSLHAYERDFESIAALDANNIGADSLDKLAELPLGVREQHSWTPFKTARWLLGGNQAARSLNLWYAQQLDAIADQRS